MKQNGDSGDIDYDNEKFSKHGDWKRSDINETKSTMPTKYNENQTLMQPVKTNSQGSSWNNAKTW